MNEEKRKKIIELLEKEETDKENEKELFQEFHRMILEEIEGITLTQLVNESRQALKELKGYAIGEEELIKEINDLSEFLDVIVLPFPMRENDVVNIINSTSTAFDLIETIDFLLKERVNGKGMEYLDTFLIYVHCIHHILINPGPYKKTLH